jgi:hypothetical protein
MADTDKPTVPQGFSVQSTSVPPSAPIYGSEQHDPATQAVMRSTPVSSLDELAKRAGRR